MRQVITRELEGDVVIYRLHGRRIRRKAELDRIAALAVPPAWTEVEIAVSPSAKVLARVRTPRDALNGSTTRPSDGGANGESSSGCPGSVSSWRNSAVGSTATCQVGA
ncbi:hypothetical protein [Tessaracoccus coleopterorum]|uniref:hypothetical protein n=1 Tax=Tessaracoccus coleopterorum TaxID=2714950 RepID=UPI0018D4C4BB|nr:hypothetical protein [Tessaracoccus coleopterorum]